MLFGELDADGVPQRERRRPFESASMDPATAGQLEALQHSGKAGLPIGTWSPSGVEVAARLRAAGFGRHTFLCGQSGSGKTFALGVILEQLLLGTELRTVVLDPNADFVRLGEARPDAPEDVAHRLGKSDIHVLGADSTAAEPLRMRFATMPRAAQAAVLRLDPLADRGEYNHFLHLMDGRRGGRRRNRAQSARRRPRRTLAGAAHREPRACSPGRSGPALCRPQPRWFRAAHA